MNKELQNKVWAVLPKEFREEVKRQYHIAIDSEQHYTLCTLEYLFGLHNLTSDADGEPKPAEPKFKVGDKVRISCTKDGIVWDNISHGRIATVKSAHLKSDDNSIWIYSFKEGIRDFAEAWLEPYTEPGKANCTEKQDNSDHIPAPTKMVDWEQRRYELAKELMKGFAANPNENVVGVSMDLLAQWSVCGADEIIKRLQTEDKI